MEIKYYFFCFFMALATNSVHADCITLPFDDKKNTEVDDRQWIVSHIEISESGEITVTTQFNNGKKVDGDHFSSVVLFSNESEHPIASVVQKVAIDATYFGNVNTETIKDVGSIEPSEMCNIKVEHGTYDVVDDQEWWRKTTEVIVEIIQIIIENGGNTTGFSNL